jgi:hypothetical protein
MLHVYSFWDTTQRAKPTNNDISQQIIQVWKLPVFFQQPNDACDYKFSAPYMPFSYTFMTCKDFLLENGLLGSHLR